MTCDGNYLSMAPTVKFKMTAYVMKCSLRAVVPKAGSKTHAELFWFPGILIQVGESNLAGPRINTINPRESFLIKRAFGER